MMNLTCVCLWFLAGGRSACLISWFCANPHWNGALRRILFLLLWDFQVLVHEILAQVHLFWEREEYWRFVLSSSRVEVAERGSLMRLFKLISCRSSLERASEVTVRWFCRSCGPVILLSPRCNAKADATGHDESRDCQVRVITPSLDSSL